jgi:hypothetical protein
LLEIKGIKKKTWRNRKYSKCKKKEDQLFSGKKLGKINWAMINFANKFL